MDIKQRRQTSKTSTVKTEQENSFVGFSQTKTTKNTSKNIRNNSSTLQTNEISEEKNNIVYFLNVKSNDPILKCFFFVQMPCYIFL